MVKYLSEGDYVSLLAYNWRKTVAKDKDYRMKNEAKCDVGYPTGFLNFDFTNGCVVHVKSEEKNLDFNYYSVGLTDGSIITFVGRSNSGKTTLLTQMAANIIRPFKTSCIFEDSVEGGLTWSRRESLSGFHDIELHERYIVRNAGVNAENFYKRIKMIHDMKIEDPGKYEYDTGLLDNFGNPLSKFEPTIYVLDSIALLMPEKYTEEDELSGNMAAPASARVVAQIFRTIIPMLKTANILLMVVNHILVDVNANPMQHKKAQTAYLKPGERMPKGDTVIYLSNTIIRVDDVSKLKENEKFRFQGSIVELEFIKSRTNGNKKTKMIFSQERGFDPVLSLFIFLVEKERISSGGSMHLDIDTEKKYKFSMSNLRDKLEKNPEFRALFMQVAQEELCKIPKLYLTDAEKEYSMSNGILDMCMQIHPKTEEVIAEEDAEEVQLQADLEEEEE
jgi:RecA/RadA recombinase